jgi:hypothetical protein
VGAALGADDRHAAGVRLPRERLDREPGRTAGPQPLADRRVRAELRVLPAPPAGEVGLGRRAPEQPRHLGPAGVGVQVGVDHRGPDVGVAE